MENFNYKIGEWVHIEGKVSYAEMSGSTSKFDNRIVHKIRIGVANKNSADAEINKLSDFVNVIFIENPHIVNPCLRSLKLGQKVVIDGITCEPIEWSDSQIRVFGESIRNSSTEDKWSEYKDELCSFKKTGKANSSNSLDRSLFSTAHVDNPETFAPVMLAHEGYRSQWLPEMIERLSSDKKKDGAEGPISE